MINKEWLVIGKSTLDKDKFVPVKNEMFVKPYGGLWASPYTPNDEYKSEWHYFSVNTCNMHQTPNDAVKFKFKKDARIYVIDNQEDLINLADTYGSINLFNSWTLLDFEKISEHFDAICLTHEGQYKTRMPIKNYRYNLYGWDVSCCLVLHFDAISEWQYIDISK